MSGIKVGIITYHFSDNFGALMQAYALRKWLQDQGCDVNFVNYHPKYVEEGGSLVSPFSLKNFRRNIKIIYLKYSKIKKKFFGNKEQEEKFNIFRKDVLGVAGVALESIEDIELAKLNYDILICGSDQIWNPSDHFGFDRVYFLDFSVHQHVRRISYAASFGKGTLDDKYLSPLRDLLKRLDGISVRERSGISIIGKVSDKAVQCVPDPTILLGNFTDFCEKNSTSKTKHVFCYSLRTDVGVRETALLASKLHHADVMSPYNPHRRWREIGKTTYPCPKEWVNDLYRSEIVVTNSFHGVALSICLEKEFVAVGLPGGKISLNARVLNLLNEVGLSNRFVASFDEEVVKNLILTRIDWSEVRSKVQVIRDVGESYLRGELERVGN